MKQRVQTYYNLRDTGNYSLESKINKAIEIGYEVVYMVKLDSSVVVVYKETGPLTNRLNQEYKKHGTNYLPTL